MYLSAYSYDQYFNNAEETTNYELIEDMAVSTLKNYCLQFPTLQEYLVLEEETKELVAKAILWQAHYEEEKLNGDVLSNVSAGKFSYSIEKKNKGQYDLHAINFLLETGICDNRINVAGCDCLCK